MVERGVLREEPVEVEEAVAAERERMAAEVVARVVWRRVLERVEAIMVSLLFCW